MGILKIVAIAFACLALVAVAALTAAGFFPVLSDIAGTGKPRDLGVHYTQADYASGLAKIPGHSIKNAEDVCVTCEFKSSGSIPVDAEFTQEEFTAQLNKLNSKKGPLRDVQIKFNADGTIEASGKAIDPRLTAPVYVKARLEGASGKRVSLAVEELEVGRVAVSQQEEAARVGEEFIADFLSNPGFSIESLEVRNGKVKFKGTFPAEIEGLPEAEQRPF